MFTKKDAIRIVCNAAKIYKEKLANKNFLIIFKSRENNKIEYFEVIFLPRNFQHLTGLEYYAEHRSVEFYNKCLNHTLREQDFEFKEDGTTQYKLQALPLLVDFCKVSKMTASLDVYRPHLYVDKLAGNISACLGFIKEGNYYIPNTCLLGDIRDFGKSTSQILAILSKPASKYCSTYNDIEYLAKGFNPDKLKDFERIQLN